MKKNSFLELKRFAKTSSFAMWKDKVSDLSIFDGDFYKSVTTKYVFIALNPAENTKDVDDWRSFHSGRRGQNDFKLCYALKGTHLWGSYVTDIFKSFVTPNSRELKEMIRKDPETVKSDIETLKKELSNFDKNVKLIAIGRQAYYYLRKYLNNYDIYFIYHYANWRSNQTRTREAYRETVLCQLKEQKIEI